MSTPLIVERPLIVSPARARAYGLEEACLLALLGDYGQYFGRWDQQGQLWLALDKATLVQLAPFWTDYDIQRISRSLHNQGVIHLKSAPFLESLRLELTIIAPVATGDPAPPVQANASHPHVSPASAPVRAARAPAADGFSLVDAQWQPDHELRQRIAEHHIPEYFIRQHLPEVVLQMRETKTPEAGAGGKFFKEILRRWRYHQTQVGRETRELASGREPMANAYGAHHAQISSPRELAPAREASPDRDSEFLNHDIAGPMHSRWRPSSDALEVLVKHAGINMAFVEDAIPEFLVYWCERGDVSKTWNTKFISHVKRQWHRLQTALENDTEPRRIPDNWRPSREVFDVLKLAEIDLKFAEQQIPEFVLFWRDSNQVYASWNTKFLQHVKYHWAKQHALITPQLPQGQQHARQQLINPTTRTRDANLTQQLNDRSWAN